MLISRGSLYHADLFMFKIIVRSVRFSQEHDGIWQIFMLIRSHISDQDVEEIGDFLYLIKETDYMNAWWFEKNVVYLFQVF